MENIDIKHSKGPWTISEGWDKIRFVPGSEYLPGFNAISGDIIDANGNVLAVVKAFESKGFVRPSSEEYKPNIMLICAAPELLAALEKAVEDEEYCLPVGDTASSWYADAKAAIAKAKNIQP